LFFYNHIHNLPVILFPHCKQIANLKPFTMTTHVPDAIKDIVEKFPASYLIVSLSEQAKKNEEHNPAMNVFVPFKGPEIYLLHKAFIDSGGAPDILRIKIKKDSVQRIYKNAVTRLTPRRGKM
jgi:hypothetical protein